MGQHAKVPLVDPDKLCDVARADKQVDRENEFHELLHEFSEILSWEQTKHKAQRQID
jgi:hypothetical protein